MEGNDGMVPALRAGPAPGACDADGAIAALCLDSARSTMGTQDASNTDPRPDVGPARKRRASLFVPVPAALMGLGLLSAAPVAPAQPVVARDDGFRVLPDTVASLPVLDNDTLPNAKVFVVLQTAPSVGNVIAQGTWFDFVPPPGFVGATSFRYCITPPGNACALVSLTVGPPATVPALGAAGLAGLAGMLGWLGVRRSRRS